MPPNKKHIPSNDVKGLKSFLKKLEQNEVTQEEIAEYYSKKLNMKVSQETISRRIKELQENEEKQ